MIEDKDESLISHLEALRSAILKSLIALSVLLPFSFFLAPKAFNYLINIILGGSKIQLNFFSPAEVFIIQIKTALIIDFVVCFPYIAKQIWNFILPALYENERKFLKSAIFFSTLLFVLGAAFCLYAMMPLVVGFGLGFQSASVTPVFGVSNIVNLAYIMSLAFGITFQVPLITIFLVKSGVISYKTVKNLRPYVIVGILIIAGILTPPDVLSQLTLAIPSYLLFEIGLLFCKKQGQKNE